MRGMRRSFQKRLYISAVVRAKRTMEFPRQIRAKKRSMELVEAARASKVCRRLDLNAPVAVGPRSHRPSSFYSRRRDTEIFVPESPIRNYDDATWQPGQILPIDQPPPPLPIDESPLPLDDQPRPSGTIGFDFQSMFQTMQHTIETHFDEVKSKLSNLEGRVIAIENSQSQIQQSSPASSSTEATPKNGKKKKIILDLQHRIRSIYASLQEEFDLDETICSEKNKKLVDLIITEIGLTEYTERQIRDGCRTYRRSLRGKRKGRSDAEANCVRIRARQQRLFEKRGRAVKSKEADVWKDVIPSMMSEEEEFTDGDEVKFFRHRQTWKSQKFSRFLDKLDGRLKKTSRKGLARERCYGEPLVAAAPTVAKSWMKCGSGQDKENEQPIGDQVDENSDVDLFDDSDTD